MERRESSEETFQQPSSTRKWPTREIEWDFIQRHVVIGVVEHSKMGRVVSTLDGRADICRDSLEK